MNRRRFLSSLIGGVAATAAVRTWPYRVFSFPSQLTDAKTSYAAIQEILRKPPLDLGFNVFDYAGLPIIADPSCPPNQIHFRLHRVTA